MTEQTITRDHHGAATRSAYLCESGERLCREHEDTAAQPTPVPSDLGYDPASHCSTCQGGGRVVVDDPGDPATCHACGGSGRIEDERAIAAELAEQDAAAERGDCDRHPYEPCGHADEVPAEEIARVEEDAAEGAAIEREQRAEVADELPRIDPAEVAATLAVAVSKHPLDVLPFAKPDAPHVESTDATWMSVFRDRLGGPAYVLITLANGQRFAAVISEDTSRR